MRLPTPNGRLSPGAPISGQFLVIVLITSLIEATHTQGQALRNRTDNQQQEKPSGPNNNYVKTIDQSRKLSHSVDEAAAVAAATVKSKSPRRGRVFAKLAANSEDSEEDEDDHKATQIGMSNQPPADETEQQQQQQQRSPEVPKEGLQQMKRAARNVGHKMSLVQDRVDQIQSQIAEDQDTYRQQQQQHQPIYSTPYNEQDLGSDGVQQSDKLTDWSRASPIFDGPSSNSSGASHSVIQSYLPPATLATQNSAANLSNPTATTGGRDDQPPEESSPTVGDNQLVADSQPGGGQQKDGYYATGSIGGPVLGQMTDQQPAESSARVASEPGSFANDANLEYFQSMNEMNHKRAPVGAAQRPDAGPNRFKNMSVVTSANDLINSYSTARQAGVAPPDEAPSVGGHRPPTKSQQQLPSTNRGPPPISTYKADYGKTRSAPAPVYLGQPQQQQQQQRNESTRDESESGWNTASSYARNGENNIYSPQLMPPATTVSYESYSAGADRGRQHYQLADRPMAVAESRPVSFEEQQLSHSGRANRRLAGHQSHRASQQHYSVQYPAGSGRLAYAHNTSDQMRHRSSQPANEDSNSVSASSSGAASAADSSSEQPPMEINSYHQAPSQALNGLIPMLQQRPSSGKEQPAQHQYPASVHNELTGFSNNNHDPYSSSLSVGPDRQDWPQNVAAGGAGEQQANSEHAPSNERVDQQQQYYYLPAASQQQQGTNDLGAQMMIDALQPAATNSQNYAQQQQYAAYYPSSSEMSSLIRRYQQQQQLLAANQDNLLPATYRDSDLATNSPSVFRRYSPSQMDSSYQTQTRTQQRPAVGQDTADYYQPAQTYFYSPQSLTANSIRSTNDLAAFYRALSAATRAPEYNSALQQQQARAAAAAAAASQYDNFVSKQPLGGSLHASAAMNTPTFYESPAGGQARSGTGQEQQQQGSNSASIDQQSARQQLKRSYSLFKPTASSRYFYAPAYGTLSPFSLSSNPAAYQSLSSGYASADPAALQSAWQQLYAAAAAQKQYAYAALPAGAYTAALASSPQSQTIDQSQQYQTLAQSGLQPTHYMADPEMAESSLMPTSSGALDASGLFSAAGPSGAAYATPQFGSATAAAYSVGQQQQQQQSDSSGDSPSSTAAAATSGDSKGRGMTPWTNIAGLLLGILPFGILMASLLPAVTVTGRKKRELEIGGRNFSELLKWRAPSKVLESLMLGPQQQQDDPTTLASIIGQQWSQFMGAGKSANRIEDEQRSSRRRSLVSGGPFSGRQRGKKSSTADQQAVQLTTNSTTLTSTSVAAVADQANTNSTQTPIPKDQQPDGGGSGGPMKSRVKKALSALNNLISAAQMNIKRKHRSSLIDSQWILPISSLKSSLKLDQLFNVTEFKRQLASAIQAKAIAAQNQILQQQQQQVQQLQKYLSRANLTLVPAVRQPPSQQQQPMAQNLRRAQLAASEMSTSKTPTNSTIQSTEITKIVAAPAPAPASTPTTTIEPATVAITVMEAPSRSRVEASLVVAERPTTSRPAESITTPVPPTGTPTVHDDNNNNNNNSTRHHLEVCLNQFLCRLTVKLNKSLKNAPLVGSAVGPNETSGPSSLSADQLERITKRYINQLVEQIEAEHPNVSLSVNRSPPGGQSPAAAGSLKSSPGGGALALHHHHHQVSDSALDVLYKNAMRNQCSLMYNCLELIQLENMLSKMKLKFS